VNVSFLPVYLDASAIVKLVVIEPESQHLATAIARWPDRVTAVLAYTEVHRALWRAGTPRTTHAQADAVLERFVLIEVDRPLLATAARFKYPTLRSLDAVHVAAALSIGDDPAAFITYDARMADAARRQRLTVLHPGVERLK
jgi:predicted nucleic acid-binding protein